MEPNRTEPNRTLVYAEPSNFISCRGNHEISVERTIDAVRFEKIKMSGKKKKSLGTVVECSETGEEATEQTAPVCDLRGRKKKGRSTFASLHSLFFHNNTYLSKWQNSNTGREKMSKSANDIPADNCSAEDEDCFFFQPVRQSPSECGSVRKLRECPLCYGYQLSVNFPKLNCCSHRACKTCLVQYLEMEIMESRVLISCPECSEYLLPKDIHSLLLNTHQHLIDKYEGFSLRRFLMMDPDTRWCPAPDCGYAVIASGCAACPQLHCERPGCNTKFCYHCKMIWHPNETCDEARRQRGDMIVNAAVQLPIDSALRPGDIKACPRCRTYIVKMNDGSCNHMVCAVCGAEFCWLCLKEISDLHYLSPSGCTFWGKSPWTRKKKLLWQLGTLLGAPAGITLMAGLAVPAIIFGVPVFIARKVYQRARSQSRARRNILTALSLFSSLIVSPILAVVAVGVGVPILLAYVYGVVPLSLCRNGGCGLNSSVSTIRLNYLEDDDIWRMTGGGVSESETGKSKSERLLDATSTATAVSFHSGSSVGVNSQQNRLQVQAELCRRRPSIESGAISLADRFNYEEASTKAMAGSAYQDDKSVNTVYSGQEAISYCDEIASTRALAGSVIDAKSLAGDTCSLRVYASLQPHSALLMEEQSSDVILLEEPSNDVTERSKVAHQTNTVIIKEGHSTETSDSNSDRDIPCSSKTIAQRYYKKSLPVVGRGTEGEFLVMSRDTFGQLHPCALSEMAQKYQQEQVENSERKHKSKSLSLLYEERQVFFNSEDNSKSNSNKKQKKVSGWKPKTSSYTSLSTEMATENYNVHRKSFLPHRFVRKQLYSLSK